MHTPFTLLLFAAMGVAGCGDAMGGGGLPAAPGADGLNSRASDAANQDAPASAIDAGSMESGVTDAGTGDGGSDAAHLPAPCVAGAAHSGNRWQDLYACYFGPAGIANCSLKSTCHVAGPNAAGFWTCGTTLDSCYQGLISSSIVPDGGMMDPTMTVFYSSLRTTDGFGGTMPYEPADVAFTPDDMMRIGAWIKSGAPNN
jgi:hypothetical protein